MRGKIDEKFWVWTIIILALAIRIYRIDWGLPWEYWGDEFVILSHSAYMALNKTLNPFTFGYPSLIFYLVFVWNSLVFLAINLFGSNTDWNTFWLSLFGNPELMALSARGLQMIINVATVYAVFKLGKFWNTTVAVVAALVMALSPLAFTESIKYGGDGIMAFFCAISLIYVAKFWTNGKSKYVILASIFAGLAAGTKYLGVVVLISLWYTIHCRAGNFKGFVKSKHLWHSLVVVVLTFIVTSPYTFITPLKFVRDFGLDTAHMLGGHMGFENLPPGFITSIFQMSYALSLGGFLLFLIGIALAVRKRDKLLIAMAVFPGALYIVTALWKVLFARYFCTALPAMAIVSAYGFVKLHKNIKWLAVFLLVLSFGELTLRDYGMLRYLSLKISDDVVREWIVKQDIPSGKIALLNPGVLGYPSTGSLRESLEKSRAAGKVDTLKYIGLLRFAPPEYRRDFCTVPLRSAEHPPHTIQKLKNAVKKLLGRPITHQKTQPIDIEGKLTRCDAKYFIAQSGYYLRHMAAPELYPEYVNFYRKLFVQKPVFEIGNEFITTRELPPLKILLTAEVAGQKLKIFDITQLPRKNP